MTDLNLIKKLQNKKPMIISTGTSSISEIKKHFSQLGNMAVRYTLLYCVSNYPLG